ncbi:hypothetical protein ACJMK2_024909 [Sinanodonta woodiana]|uniref:Uncharacterized protein n=1 Tax=Sinanodonta woodiana TaxID=1069815 RepID=A0ABD3XHA8_SINWO
MLFSRVLSPWHKNTDVIYVTQRYTQIPKVIRDNCNILAVFNGVDTHTLRNIWQTWCGGDMDFNVFKNFFSHAQSVPHGFVTINLHDPRTHHRILGQHNVPVMLSLTCNITNVTLIKIQMMLSTLQHVVLTYDVTQENNTEVGNLYRYRIEGCEVNENNFSFTIRNVSWTDLGVYVAWSDTNILMDSVLLEFEDHNSTSSPERTPIYFTSSSVPTTLKLMAENYMLEWIFISTVVVLLLAAGVIVNALRRNRPKSKITSIHLTYMNGRQSIANSSCSRSNNTEISYTIDGSTMPLRLNNCSHALTDLSHAQTQGMIPNGKQSCNQGEYSVHTTVRKDMMHPSVSSSCETSESDSTFDDCDQYDEMPNEYQYERPKGPKYIS